MYQEVTATFRKYEKQLMDFDTALEHVGEFGRHQTRIYFIVSVISVPLCSQMLIVVFIGAVPDSVPEWKCH